MKYVDIIEFMYSLDYRWDTTDFESIFSKAIRELRGLTQLDSDRKAQAYLNRGWKLFIEKHEQEVKANQYPTFNILDYTTKSIQPYYKTIKKDDLKIIKIKKKIEKRHILLKYISEELTNREYEALGCYLCYICDSSKVFLTNSSDEHGIDFVAIIPAYSKLHIFPNSNKQLKIVGQCKKWGSPAKRDHVDLLRRSIQKIQDTSIHIKKFIPNWFFQEKGNIIGVLVSNSGAQSGAIQSSIDYGYTIANSKDIAQAIVLSSPLELTSGEIIENMMTYINKILEK
jgi:hypothetical protein